VSKIAVMSMLPRVLCLYCAHVKQVVLLQAERDGLTRARQELERKLETKELEMHEKEEELFLQLERVVRLEEDFEKASLGFSTNSCAVLFSWFLLD